MTDELTEVLELLDSLCKDPSISRNIRATLKIIRQNLDGCKELGITIDSALQKVEDISLNPNLPVYARSQIWNLTSMLESVNNTR
ncbi:hypothetical protein GF374_01125 [Candidatus Woesearchaeota archaeon]|nr:hypothetical protein [Candidatus Woesearchaeota archaeon]